MTMSKGVKRGGNLGDSDGSESSFLSDTALAAAMATVVRAPHKDLVVVKKEWAALRIQTAFQGFLARHALSVLKAVVRIQVRNQAAVTLTCMQALVRVQALVRARCNQTSVDGDATKGSFVDSQADPIKQAEEALGKTGIINILQLTTCSFRFWTPRNVGRKSIGERLLDRI
ncbi:protein IQ-DOMAIN 8 isoform X1 [Capsicum annuum]|uniref:protein IQ-DOMAIN 8 isoform X1 n=1 Tax=Capsicum annuum TaxID=4072 RepID=UPI001FB197AD|nr:protein IQ-DOMAIN 8 isoform X1 [Capsicum annuum]